MMSGPRVTKFRSGWAVKLFWSSRGHFFVRDGLDMAVSLCGAVKARGGHLFEIGTFPRCKRCEQKQCASQ